MKLKKKDLMIHSSTGSIVTVLKTYIENDVQYVQGLCDGQIVFDKVSNFKPIDCLLLRCNNCNKEIYEIELEVEENSQLYKCECGSSTFTALNLDIENY